ncbi:MAG: hypothetical protein RMA76_00470 [Deltaproteobacteria bacterium]
MRWAAMSFVVVAACSGSSIYLEPPPTIEEHQTLIFALETDGTLVIDVHDLSVDAFVFDAELDAERIAGTALLYDASVEQLGLRTGRLESVSSEVCGAAPLPAASRVFRFSAEGARTNGWEEGPLGDVVSAFRYAGPCVCPTFEVVREFDIPNRRHVFVVAAVDETQALLFAGPSDEERGTGYWLTAESATEVGFDFGRNPDAIHVDGEDIWLSSNAALYRGTAAGDFVQTATVPSGNIVSIAGRADDLFFASDEGALMHAVGEDFEQWAQHGRPDGSAQRAAVLRLGPRHVAYSPPGLLDFDVYRDAQLIDQHSTLADTRGMFAMVELDAFGIFAVYEGSDAFQYTGGELLSLGAPELAFPGDLIRYRADTAIYGTISGELQAYVVDHGFCATRLPVATAPRIQRLVLLGDQLLLIGEPPGSRTVLRVQVLASGRSEG